MSAPALSGTSQVPPRGRGMDRCRDSSLFYFSDEEILEEQVGRVNMKMKIVFNSMAYFASAKAPRAAAAGLPVQLEYRALNSIVTVSAA